MTSSRIRPWRHRLLPGLLLLSILPFVPAVADEEAGDAKQLAYRTSAEVSASLRRLAARADTRALPVELMRYGTSHGGRALEALRIGASRSVVLVHGGLGRCDAAGRRWYHLL